jgi:hypothetical protein
MTRKTEKTFTGLVSPYTPFVRLGAGRFRVSSVSTSRPSVPGHTPPAMSATPVGKALEKVIWEVHQCELVLSAGGGSDQARIVDKLEDLVRSLPLLRAAAASTEAADDDAFSATLLPVSALVLVDEGRNPTRGMVDALLDVGLANAVTKGKTNVFAALHAELTAQNETQPRVGVVKKEEKNVSSTLEAQAKRKRGG